MKKIFTLLMICALILMTGCGGDSNSGKKLSVMLESNVVSLDSAKRTDSASFEMIANCIDGLMQLDANGKPIPAIAERRTARLILSTCATRNGLTAIPSPPKILYSRGVVTVKRRKNTLTSWATPLLA